MPVGKYLFKICVAGNQCDTITSKTAAALRESSWGRYPGEFILGIDKQVIIFKLHDEDSNQFLTTKFIKGYSMFLVNIRT